MTRACHGCRRRSRAATPSPATWQRAYVAGDLREAVNTLEEVAPTARRVLGGAHPLTKEIEEHLRQSRAALRARETPSRH